MYDAWFICKMDEKRRPHHTKNWYTVDSFDTRQFTDMTLTAKLTGGSTPKEFTYSFKVVPAQVAKIQPSVADADILADVTRHTIKYWFRDGCNCYCYCYCCCEVVVVVRSLASDTNTTSIDARTHKTTTTTTTNNNNNNKGVVQNTNCTTYYIADGNGLIEYTDGVWNRICVRNYHTMDDVARHTCTCTGSVRFSSVRFIISCSSIQSSHLLYSRCLPFYYSCSYILLYCS